MLHVRAVVSKYDFEYKQGLRPSNRRKTAPKPQRRQRRRWTTFKTERQPWNVLPWNGRALSDGLLSEGRCLTSMAGGDATQITSPSSKDAYEIWSRHPCRPPALITSWPYLLETWRSEVCKHRRTGFTGIIPQAKAAVCGDRWAVYFNRKIDPAEFVSMFCGDYVPQAFLDTLRIPDMPVLKHPALHGGHVASSHSDMAWSSSMLLTGFRADFFHQPVTFKDFFSKSDAYKFVGRVIRTHCRMLEKSQDGFICSQKELHLSAPCNLDRSW